MHIFVLGYKKTVDACEEEYKHTESSEVYNKEEMSNMANKVMFSSQG